MCQRPAWKNIHSGAVTKPLLSHRFCSPFCLRIFRYLPTQELRLENDDLEFDIFKLCLTEPHSVNKTNRQGFFRLRYLNHESK